MGALQKIFGDVLDLVSVVFRLYWKVLIPLLIVLLFVFVHISSNVSSGPVKQVCFYGDDCVTVDIADEPAEWDTGLMGRQGLEKNTGLLYILPEEREWRTSKEGVSFPTDIMWLDSELIVVHIEANAQPCGEDCEFFTPPYPSSYILEVEANYADKYLIEPGMKVTFKR